MTSFESRLFIGFGAIIALVLVISAYSFYNGNKRISTSNWVIHTNQVLFESSQTMLLSNDIERAVMNYAISGDSGSVSGFEAGKQQLLENIEKLRVLTADNHHQQKRLQQLSTLIHEQINYYSQCILLRNTRGTDEAIAFLKTPIVATLPVSIRKLNTDIQSEEKTLLEKRQQESDGTIDSFNRAFIAFLLIISSLVLFIFFMIRRNMDYQRKAELQNLNHQRESKELLSTLKAKVSELEIAQSGLNEALIKEKYAKEEIDGLNHTLEEKVNQRTGELEESNRELEAFSYSVSHDLRTPLRAINGYAKIIEEDYSQVIDEQARSLLQSIKKNASTMGTLIDGLLAFSRLGRKDIQKREINMTEVAEEVVWEMNNLSRHEAQITINNLHPCSADRDLMKQVFMNLLSNAVKFTAQRKNPMIEIGSAINESGIVYFVKDNGVGFNMAYHEKLFNVFHRLHSVKQFEGTGVGLALVKRIITKHGGTVWAEGKEEEGAVFSFLIP